VCSRNLLCRFFCLARLLCIMHYAYATSASQTHHHLIPVCIQRLLASGQALKQALTTLFITQCTVKGFSCLSPIARGSICPEASIVHICKIIHVRYYPLLLTSQATMSTPDESKGRATFTYTSTHIKKEGCCEQALSQPVLVYPEPDSLANVKEKNKSTLLQGGLTLHRCDDLL
jgi:hypothetical protein